MPWKHFELSKVDRIVWLHVPLGICGPSAVLTLTKLLKEKETPTEMDTPFKIRIELTTW